MLRPAFLLALLFRQVLFPPAHLGQQIVDYCADGSRWGVGISYSREAQPLETAGGIVNALPLLGSAPFLVVNGDVWLDYDFNRLAGHRLPGSDWAHLVMVDNPAQHPRGDFHLDEQGLIRELAAAGTGLTYAGVGVYSPGFFAGLGPGKTPLRPLLDTAIARSTLSGEYYPGRWEDVGTPQRLQRLDAALRAGAATAHPD
jgi:MurNAc alpha-1-phosphate uridylyltransferase